MYRLRPCRRIAADTRTGSVSAIQFYIRRIAMARRAVKELTALAERRAARCRVASRRFRPLSEAEAEAIVGADFLARLATTMRRA